MSRVLVLTRELPYPPNAGDRIVTYGFVSALERRGHDVHLLSYTREDDDDAAAALRSTCESVVRVPSTDSALHPTLRKAARAVVGRSDVMAMFDSGALRRATARQIATVDPDVVLAQHPYTGQCFLDDRIDQALEAADAEPMTSAHVVEYAAHTRQRSHAAGLRARLALRAEIPRLRRAELAVYDRSARTLVLGTEDRATLRERNVGPVHLQRVGLDVAAHEPVKRVHRPRASDGGPRGNRLVFFGSYDWFPNADAARRLCEVVLPAVRRRRPATRLVLAGRGAPPEIRAYGQRDGIDFRGEVDDLAALVRTAAAVVAPIRVGGGIRIKILESMAWGVPVVTTPAGAEGIDAVAGDDLLVATDVTDFVAETIRLLDDERERRRLSTNARETVEERYSIGAIAGELEKNLGVA